MTLAPPVHARARRDTPDVSVLIPCYNQAHFLSEAIASVVPGTRRVEIVVVDDGSSDATSETARSFPHVRCIRQPNAGLAAARNRAFQESTGAFVILLDADDRLLPCALEAGMGAFLAHPDCGMVFGRCVMMGADGRPWPTPWQEPIVQDHHAALLRRNVIWMPAMAMFRREALESAGGFARGFDAAADYDLYLRLSRAWPIHDHAQIVAAYRRHGGNMSTNATRMLIETEAVMRRNRPSGDEHLLDAWREGRRQWREFYSTHLVEEIRAHVHAAEWSPALRKALTLARRHPTLALRETGRKARRSLRLARRQPAVVSQQDSRQ